MGFMKKAIDVIVLIQQISKQLQSVYSDFTLCQQYAWWIFEAIIKKNKAQLIAQEIIILTEEQQNSINQWVDKLVNEKIPIQYLIGSVPFNRVEILVKSPVLIPRQETSARPSICFLVGSCNPRMSG